MLSHKLHRFVKNIRAEQRTVVAASVALGTFIRNLSVNNANQSPNSTSFCSPSFSFSSPSQMGCDEIGHRSNGSWMRFQLDQLPAGHLFRNNAINNMGFISGSVVQSYTSQKPPLSRQLHTSSLFMSIYSRTTSIHLQLLQEKKSTSTLGFNGRNTRFLMTPQDQRFYSKGKDDKESESSNNLLNDSKTSANGAGRPNLDLPINTIPIKDGLQTRASVTEFLGHLTEEQKGLLYHSLNVVVLRDKYEGHLGSSKSESHHYLSKFGRPTAAVGEEPTGTLCEVPPKWLHTRLVPMEDYPPPERLSSDEKLHPPSAAAIWAVGIKNALPFIGFGFLDNLIMILAGDYIDITIGTTLGISTMAAAALGNTISDVAGIGSAWYVEELANKVGIKDPQLTPSQFASWSVRWASNGGRAIGVVIGCLLGMVPLLFLPSAEEKEKEAKAKAASVGNGTSAVDESSKKDTTKN